MSHTGPAPSASSHGHADVHSASPAVSSVKPVKVEPPSPYKGERVICEFYPSLNENNGINRLAASLPLGLGLFIYAPAYVAKAAVPMTLEIVRSLPMILRILLVPVTLPLKLLGGPLLVRYVLTTMRLRVDHGLTRTAAHSVPLENIDHVRLQDETTFTRTGNLEIVSNGRAVLTLVGVQNPRPSLQTILDAVHSRKEVEKVMHRQRQAQSAAGAAVPQPAT